MDGADKPCQNFTKVRIDKNMEQQATGAAAGESTLALTADKINRLKGGLEAKLAQPHVKAHWEGMFEDCEIILNHLASQEHDRSGQENAVRTVPARV
jgi:hypothetical protein